jgi:hypothetical protein
MNAESSRGELFKRGDGEARGSAENEIQGHFVMVQLDN